MTRVANLTTDNPDFDELKSLESEREPTKVTLVLSPQTEFIVENLMHKLSSNRTATVRTLLEAAVLDWLEASGYEPDSERFKEKYLAWLKDYHLSSEDEYITTDPRGGEVWGRIETWSRVAL